METKNKSNRKTTCKLHYEVSIFMQYL